MRKLFREIRESENKEEYLEEIESICRIYRCRRFYGSECYFSHLVWNTFNVENPILKYDGNVIHHKDEDKLNDDISNLQKMTKSKHVRLHSTGNKNMLGKNHSEETKKKLSEALKGIIKSKETRRKLSLANKGKSPSQKTIECALKKTRKPVLANFIKYKSVSEAAKKLSVSRPTILYRISTKKLGYFYINETNKFKGVK